MLYEYSIYTFILIGISLSKRNKQLQNARERYIEAQLKSSVRWSRLLPLTLIMPLESTLNELIEVYPLIRNKMQMFDNNFTI